MADAVVEEIRAAGGQAVADSSDVANEGADIVGRAISAFEGLHIVVNNAGIAGGGTLDTIPMDEWHRMLAIHLGGTLSVARAAWPILRNQGYGRIVNTSSASVFGLPGSSVVHNSQSGHFRTHSSVGPRRVPIGHQGQCNHAHGLFTAYPTERGAPHPSCWRDSRPLRLRRLSLPS